jgi:hypothetical protein
MLCTLIGLCALTSTLYFLNDSLLNFSILMFTVMWYIIIWYIIPSRSAFSTTKHYCNVSKLIMAVPWLTRLVAGLSPRRPGFDPGSVRVRIVVDKLALGQVFSPNTSVFPCQFHSTCAPLYGKWKKLIIFLTGLHNKP